MDNFRHLIVSGVAWNILAQGASRIAQLGIGICLARLLSPREFGLVAMILVFTGFAQFLGDLGFGSAVIHKREVREEHLSSLFWLNVGMGTALTLLFGLAAPLVADFYGEPILSRLTMFVALTFITGFLGIVHGTLLTKALNFRALAIAGTTSVIIGGSVGITMAYMNFGVWSLALQLVLSSATNTILLWWFSKWRPRAIFDKSALRELFGFGASLLGTRTLHYWVRHLDDLLIGRFIGSNGLGIYSRAHRFLVFPIDNISGVVSRVMFPSLCQIQDDIYRVKKTYLRMATAIAMITFPVMTVLFATAESCVLGLLGEQWAEMIPIVKIFCVLSIAQAISTLNGTLFLSQGRPDLQFKMGLFLKPIRILGIVIGLRWGVLGVTVGGTITSLINVYPSIRIGGGLVNMKFGELMRELSGLFVCAAVMGIMVAGLDRLLGSFTHLIRLGVAVAFGSTVYWLLIHACKLKAYVDVKQTVRQQWAFGNGHSVKNPD